jgi:hypothetical protein
VQDLVGLEHHRDRGVERVLSVDDADARGLQPRHNQVTALDVRVRRPRAERGAAGVPAEMVELVAGVRHLDAADELAVSGRPGGQVEHPERVGAAV